MSSKMRVHTIAVRQPQASLIAHGKVMFATFPFRKSHKGLIAIYADKRHEANHSFDLANPVAAAMLTDIGYIQKPLPHSSIVAFAHLAGMVKTEVMRPKLEEQGATVELEMSDWSDGRWAWLFTQAKVVTREMYLERPHVQPFWMPELRKSLVFKYAY